MTRTILAKSILAKSILINSILAKSILIKSILIWAFLLAACSQSSGTVMGVVVAVDGDLTSVRSFTLLVEGDEMTFVPTTDGEYAYPLTHLRDHLLDGVPVRVGWEQRGDQLVALILDDG